MNPDVEENPGLLLWLSLKHNQMCFLADFLNSEIYYHFYWETITVRYHVMTISSAVNEDQDWYWILKILARKLSSWFWVIFKSLVAKLLCLRKCIITGFLSVCEAIHMYSKTTQLYEGIWNNQSTWHFKLKWIWSLFNPHFQASSNQYYLSFQLTGGK